MSNSYLFHNMLPHFRHIVHRICTPSWEIAKAPYTFHNLILIYDGDAGFVCSDRDYKASRGNLVYFKPGENRLGYTYANNPMKCFAADFYYICPIYNEGNWDLEAPLLPLRTVESINDAYLFSKLLNHFNDLAKVWLSGSRNRIVRCRSIFMEIILLLLDWKSGNNLNYDKIRKVEKVVSFMTDNYKKKLTLADLAGVIQVSPSYLGSIFRDVTGKSPAQYLLDIRINKAKDLIAEGYSISQTATLVGFSDVFYFSKYFKKHEGVSPSYYKNSQE